MASTDCFDEDSLFAFALGELSPERAASVNAHLASCAECRVALAEMARGTEDTHPGGSAAANPAAPLRRGEAVGRYLIDESLGAGRMGVVYRAFDPQLARMVALTLLRHERAG